MSWCSVIGVKLRGKLFIWSAQYVFVSVLLICSLPNAGHSYNCRRTKMSLVTLMFSAVLFCFQSTLTIFYPFSSTSFWKQGKGELFQKVWGFVIYFFVPFWLTFILLDSWQLSSISVVFDKTSVLNIFSCSYESCYLSIQYGSVIRFTLLYFAVSLLI